MIDKRLIGFSTVDFDSSNILYGIDVVKRDLLNEFNTPLGSRVGLPTFGSIAPQLIFEQLTDANKDELQQDCIKIINADPRVTLSTIDITEGNNGIEISMSLTYVPADLTFDLYVNFQNNNVEG